MIVKWDCNCIGITTPNPKKSLVLWACDDGNSLGYQYRDQSDKNFMVLEEDGLYLLNKRMEAVFKQAAELTRLEEAITTVAEHIFPLFPRRQL